MSDMLLETSWFGASSPSGFAWAGWVSSCGVVVMEDEDELDDEEWLDDDEDEDFLEEEEEEFGEDEEEFEEDEDEEGLEEDGDDEEEEL